MDKFADGVGKLWAFVTSHRALMAIVAIAVCVLVLGKSPELLKYTTVIACVYIAVKGAEDILKVIYKQ